jgi:hypothetical protein
MGLSLHMSSKISVIFVFVRGVEGGQTAEKWTDGGNL